MPLIELDGADGPLASLEVGTKYTTTSFPEDLAESPYFILFRANKKYRLSDLVRRTSPSSESSNSGTFSDFLVDVGSSLPDAALSLIQSPVGEENPEFQNLVGKVGNAFGELPQRRRGISVSLPSHSFALPIPTNLSTQYQSKYGSPELGPVGRLAMDAAGQGPSGDGLVNDIVNRIRLSGEGGDASGFLGNLGMQAAEPALGAILGGLFTGPIGAAVGAAGGVALKGAFAGLRVARNPHIANVFEGVDFKTHSFQYKLIAKTKKESDTIRDLIRNFKYHMAPGYKAGQGDHIFEYPSEFDIQLRAGDYLFEFGSSVLQSFNVNYTGEGAPYFFEDTNAPYSVTIDMQFKETSIVTKEEIKRGR